MDSGDFARSESRVAGLRLRAYRGEADLPAMVEVANASLEADGMESRRTLQELQRNYASLTNCDPATDMVMAEVDGALVGYARGWWWTDLDGSMLLGQIAFVLPAFRRCGIGTAMQDWLEQRQREIAAGHPAPAHWHHVFVTGREVARAALLRRSGYAPVREFLMMSRPTLDDIPGIPLPAGFEVRPVRPEHHRAIWQAHVEALQDHWGMQPPTEENFQSWLKSPTFQPQLWQIAWDIETGQVAGQVKPYIDAANNAMFGRQRGWTEFISVGRPWRRRGIARALVVRALQAQRDAGMTESALGVDSENAYGAVRLYGQCGFRVVERNCVYRKGTGGVR